MIFVNGDILDYEKLQKSCISYDLIIRLDVKTDVSDSKIYPEITNEINVIGTENEIRCCIENKIKKIIFAPSAVVYGESKITINENSQTNPVSPYGKIKLKAEQLIKKIL